MMVNYEVRHLKQSFVTAKIRFRVEVTFCTQFARAPINPLEQTAALWCYWPTGKRYFYFLVPFSEQTVVEDLQAPKA